MKKTLTITALMTLALFSWSQALIQENKLWNVVECINFGMCQTRSFVITGDTIIDQKEYKKLYTFYDTASNNRYLFGAMREIENQVFFYSFEYSTEEMLYDFNLGLGDTFNTTNNANELYNCPLTLVVSLVDTVSLENGEQRRRINFAEGEYWICGIGSRHGLVFVGADQCFIDLFYDLSCCHEDEVLLYQDPAFDECYINTVGFEEERQLIKTAVYPNPFSQLAVLKFDYSKGHNYQLQIFNGIGQIVMSLENISSGEILIDGENLRQGFYYYHLSHDSKAMASGKIIRK